MARVKRAVNGRKKRQTYKERSKGYYGAGSRTFRGMKEHSQHAGRYQYRDRRNKKRDFRSLWIQRINAAARMNGLTYSTFMHGLKLAGVELDRKVLAEIAYSDEQTFADLANVAKAALDAEKESGVVADDALEEFEAEEAEAEEEAVEDEIEAEEAEAEAEEDVEAEAEEAVDEVVDEVEEVVEEAAEAVEDEVEEAVEEAAEAVEDEAAEVVEEASEVEPEVADEAESEEPSAE